MQNLGHDLRACQIPRPAANTAGAKPTAKLAAGLGGNAGRRAGRRRD